MNKTKNGNIQFTKTSYRKDKRPRHGCEGCGEITRMNVVVKGCWEDHTCSKCGHTKSYRVG